MLGRGLTALRVVPLLPTDPLRPAKIIAICFLQSRIRLAVAVNKVAAWTPSLVETTDIGRTAGHNNAFGQKMNKNMETSRIQCSLVVQNN